VLALAVLKPKQKKPPKLEVYFLISEAE